MAWVFEVVVFPLPPLIHHFRPSGEDITILSNIAFYQHCDPYFSYVYNEPIADIENSGKITKSCTRWSAGQCFGAAIWFTC